MMQITAVEAEWFLQLIIADEDRVAAGKQEFLCAFSKVGKAKEETKDALHNYVVSLLK